MNEPGEAPAPHRPERGQVAWLLRPTAREVRRMYDEALRPDEMTFEEFLVLQAVAALEPTSAARVAQALRLPDRTADKLFAGLVRRGLVERRRREGWGPSRAHLLTGAGRAAYRVALPQVAAVDVLIADALPCETVTLVSGLEAVTAVAARHLTADQAEQRAPTSDIGLI